MVVRNRSTKALHTLPKEKFDKMSPKNKALFDIVEDEDEQKVIKVAGDKKSDGKTQTKNKK